MRFLAAVLAAGLLVACTGEDREERVYGPRAYEIAGDTLPWSNPPFDGSQRAWEQQMDHRARLQNEYARIQ